MRFFVFFSFISITFLSTAQNNYSKEISLISENDLYTSIIRDGYYTNGLFLTYRTIKNDITIDLPKKIYKFQLGQLMFTPSRSTLITASSQDRPFAGYLYANFGISRFYKSNNIFTTDLEVGAIGPNGMGEELQTFIHTIYNFPKPLGCFLIYIIGC